MKRCAAMVMEILFPCLYAFSSFSQSATDSSFYSKSVNTLRNSYFQEIGENAEVFNGREYIRNGQKVNGFPYFESNEPLTGRVSYQGVVYPEMDLLYDLQNDELITRNFSKTGMITLSKQKIDSFTLGSHHFILLSPEKGNATLKFSGFYEQLVYGRVSVFEKREKHLSTPSGYEDPKFLEYSSYYLLMNEKIFPVENEHDLLDLLADRRDALKKYIHENKLNFKKRFGDALTNTVTYYCLLKH